MLFGIVLNPLGPCSSSVGSASAPGTPKFVNDGPMARMITLLLALPLTINPPISVLSPVRTRSRVEILRSLVVAIGVADGVGVGIGVEVAVAVAVGVAVAVAVAVAVGVGVGVAMGVAVAVAVAVGVGLAVGVGCSSNEPISMRALKTRE